MSKEKNKLSISVFVIFATVFIIPNVYAAGWYEHELILDEARAKTQQSEVSQICTQNIEYCRAGALLPDGIGIFGYFKCWFGLVPESKCSYRVTHNWGYVDRMINECLNANDKKGRALAIGTAVGHLVVDTIYHTEAVPRTIEQDKCPNIVCHLMMEAKRENQIKDDPRVNYVVPIAQNALNVLLEDHSNDLEFKKMYPNYNDYLDIAICAMGKDPPLTKQELRKNIIALAAILVDNEFYTRAIGPDEDSPSLMERTAAKIYPTLISMSSLLPTPDLDEIHRLAVQRAVEVFNNWQLRYGVAGKYPHGFEALIEAEKSAIPIVGVWGLWSFIIAGIFFLIFMGIRFVVLRIPFIGKLYKSVEDKIFDILRGLVKKVKKQ